MCKHVRDDQIETSPAWSASDRAIIYRHFSGKEELLAVNLVSYLEELKGRLTAAAVALTTASWNGIARSE